LGWEAGGEKAEEAEGVADVLEVWEVVEKRLLKSAFCVPCCGVGWAYWVAEDGVAVEMEL
jgi:hypothetical protein